ncbi:MAG: glycosyltransferase family 9 protein [Candidatus Woesearchaeota archaeon]
MDRVDLMRLLDKYIGIPICLILSTLELVRKPFVSNKGRPIKKILIIQISEMGSTIHAYSSMKLLKSKHPEAKIFYLIFKEMQESIKLLRIIPDENILTIRSSSTAGFIFDTIKTIVKIRMLRIDTTIDLELFARFSNILSYLSEAQKRIGFDAFKMEGLYRGSLLTHRVIYNHTTAISANFLALAKATLHDQSESPLLKSSVSGWKAEVPKIVSTPREKELIRKRLEKINPSIKNKKHLVLINPNASQLLPLRRWPVENYIELARRLLKNEGTYVVVTGVKAEKAEAQAICKAVDSPRCIDFTGETTLRTLIDLYNVSDLLVSNDSGPPNFASLTTMSTIVLFGPETPLCYKPLGENIKVIYSNFACSPCVSAYNHRKSACKDNKCLQAISVEKVYNAAMNELKAA